MVLNRISPLTLVNAEYELNSFEKLDLVPLSIDKSILLNRQAARMLEKLMIKIDGWKNIAPVSGWRSKEEQQEIWDETLSTQGEAFTRAFVAYPGHSEHQTGLAIDLGIRKDCIDFIRPDFPYDGVAGEFRKNAAEFGFVERYPMGKQQITGIAHEPWHFRYVGEEHARIMERMGLVLEEYVLYANCYRDSIRSGEANELEREST